MERLLIIRRKISNPVDGSGSPITLEFFKQDIIPMRFVRGLRLRVESDPQGSNNLIKSLLIFIEFNGSDLGGETPDEVLALGRLDIIEQKHIENFFKYFDEIVQELAGSTFLVTLVTKENEDFKP